MPAPAFDDDLGFGQAVEDLAIEQLVAELGVEALAIAVLPWTALVIESMLEDLDCKITASVARLAQVQEIAATAEIDFAVLDVNHHSQFIFPVAEILRASA